jgi:hypothetical protein
MLNRADIEQQYEVETDSRGNSRIRSLGKFQSEPAYTPYFWEQFLDGCSDEDVDGNLFFIVTPEDREQFPELADVYGIALHENNTGFVDSYRLKTQKDYDDAVRNCEDMEAADLEEESC